MGRSTDGLQMPFLQSDELSRFLSSSKEWSALASNDQDPGYDDIDTNQSSIDFLGHYAPFTNQSLLTSLNDFNDNNLPPPAPPHLYLPYNSTNYGQQYYGMHVNGNEVPNNNNSGNTLGINPSTFGTLSASANDSSDLAAPYSTLYETSAQPWIGTGNNSTTPLSGNVANAENKFIATGGFADSFGPSSMGSSSSQPVLGPQIQDQSLNDTANGKNDDIYYKSSSDYVNRANNTGDDNSYQQHPGKKLRSSSSSASRVTGNLHHFTEDEIQEHLNSAKYLLFNPPVHETALYGQRGEKTEINISVSLAGNFFLSEPNPSDFSERPTASDDVPPDSKDEVVSMPKGSSLNSGTSGSSRSVDLNQYDLTFYRRNLFHVTAIVSNAHNAVYAATHDASEKSRILSLSLAVSVTGNDKKPPKPLVYCPPRSLAHSDTNNQTSGPAVKMIYPKRSGYDEVVNWKRLQFRTATAYNGRKKMRNFVAVVVSVYAELENAQRVCLLTSTSKPIVVRGRNPRFYQNRENITIPGGVINRSFSDRSEAAYVPSMQYQEDTLNRAGSLDEDYDDDDDEYPIKSEGVSYNAHEPKVRIKSEESTNSLLSLMDSETSNVISGTTNDADSLLDPSSAKSTKRDFDYEYFPMPLNYYLPPVEVVYRPHAVHHPMKIPPKQGKLPGQPKRSFAATN